MFQFLAYGRDLLNVLVILNTLPDFISFNKVDVIDNATGAGEGLATYVEISISVL
jgi:hypothetical protein